MNWTVETGTIEIAVNGTVVNTIVSPCLVEEIGSELLQSTANFDSKCPFFSNFCIEKAAVSIEIRSKSQLVLRSLEMQQ